MNWDQVQGKWKQLRGSVKQKWGKLTDNDLDYIAGSREQFIGRLQERYGIAKEEAQKQLEEWVNSPTVTGMQQQAGAERQETHRTSGGSST